MNKQVKEIEFGEITPQGTAILKDAVDRQYNDIASKYGAALIPLPGRQAQQNVRYKLLSPNAVISAEPLRWVIKGIIPEKGIGAIYGPAGSAKTFLALDVALSISKGDRWFGYRTKQRPVVYVCLEGEAGLSVRLAAYGQKNRQGRQIYFITQPCSLMVKKDVNDLINSISASNICGGVVIIDTLNRAAPGMDENSSSDMGKVIDAVKHIQLAVGGIVLLVHHTGKDQAKGMRGHSSLFAALDATIEVKRNGEQREWSVSKAKDGEDGQKHPFILEKVVLGEDEDGEEISSCIIIPTERSASKNLKPLTPSQKLGVDTFMTAAAQNIGSENQKVHATIDQWRSEFKLQCPAETDGGKRSVFSRVRNELVQMGKLVCENDVYSLPAGFAPIASHESKASQ